MANYSGEFLQTLDNKRNGLFLGNQQREKSYYESYTGNVPLLNAYYQMSKSNLVTCTNRFLLSVFAYALKWVDFNILDFLNESGI